MTSSFNSARHSCPAQFSTNQIFSAMKKLNWKGIVAVAIALTAQEAMGQAGVDWQLLGNAGTTNSHYVGTSDARPLVFRTTALERMRILSGGDIGVGYATPTSRLHVISGGATAGVFQASIASTSNTAINASAGYSDLVTSSTGPLRTGVAASATGGTTSNTGVSATGTVAVSQTTTNNYGLYAYGQNLGTATQNYGTYTWATGAGNANTGLFAKASGGALKDVGVDSKVELNAPTNYAFYGIAVGGGTTHYGIYAYANGSNTNYSVYGQGAVGATSYSGYFNGPQAFTSVAWTVSDRNLKKNIEPLRNSLSILMKLAPKRYEFDQAKHPGMVMAEGEQFGLLSQEVEAELPTLVKTVHHPDQYDVDGKLIEVGFDFKGMNYMGLLPLMIGGIQEQQKLIEEQQEKIERLENLVESLVANSTSPNSAGLGSNGTAGKLEQNAPNPFSAETRIRFTLPQAAMQASLVVANLEGKPVKTFRGLTGNGSVVVDGSALAPGTYTYSLFVDGQAIDTKLMVLTK